MHANYDPTIKQFLDVEFTNQTIGIQDPHDSNERLQPVTIQARINDVAFNAQAELSTVNEHTAVLTNLITRLRHPDERELSGTEIDVKAEKLFERALGKIKGNTHLDNAMDIRRKREQLADALEAHIHKVNKLKAKELLSKIPVASLSPPPAPRESALTEGKVKLSRSPSQFSNFFKKDKTSELAAASSSLPNLAPKEEKEKKPVGLIGKIKSFVLPEKPESSPTAIDDGKSGVQAKEKQKAEAPGVSDPRKDLDGIKDAEVKNLMTGIVKSFQTGLLINRDGSVQIRERLGKDTSSNEEKALLRSSEMVPRLVYTLKVLSTMDAIQKGSPPRILPNDPDKGSILEVATKLLGSIQAERDRGGMTPALEKLFSNAASQFIGANQLMHYPSIYEESTLARLNDQALNSRHGIDIARFVNTASLTMQNDRGVIAAEDKRATLARYVAVLAENLGLDPRVYEELITLRTNINDTRNVDEESFNNLATVTMREDSNYQNGIGRILNACAQGQILGTTAPLQALLDLPTRPSKPTRGPITSVAIDTRPESPTKGQVTVTQEMDIPIDPKNPNAVVRVKLEMVTDKSGRKFVSAKPTFLVSPDWTNPQDSDYRGRLTQAFRDSGYQR